MLDEPNSGIYQFLDSYYAPQIFQSIGYNGQKASLLASGIYGVVKVRIPDAP